MRSINAMPVIILAATLALAACDDQQATQTESAPPPATDTTAAPVTGEAPRQETDLATASPATPDSSAQGSTAQDAPAANEQARVPMDSGIGLPQSNLAPPPTPSSSFAGPEAMSPPDSGAAGAVLADAPFEAGTYTVDDLSLELTEEGDFTFVRSDTGETVSGDFRVYGDMMTFSNVGADTAPGMFPMTCRVQPSEGGFQLTADGPSCELFDGRTFVRG